ncbi:MAG: class I SAM-dependent methyltransferase [Flavobacteriales bacterium]|jgi:2-polyprenyl-3-methyl-5-hydroxy-6-metoxy-1,4-benzoquinol methylase
MSENQFNPAKEQEFLNSLVSDYKDVSPYSQLKKEIILSLIDSQTGNRSECHALQLGCANGYETEQLAQRVNRLVVADGSSVFIERVKAANTHSNVEFIETLFEDLHASAIDSRFDFIFCNYILEHVYDTDVILRNMHSLLKPDGIMFIVVPNAYALSRQLAQAMGLVINLDDLTENDHKHGHRRVYDAERITNDVERNGFKVVFKHGIVLKILADFQLNKLLHDGFLTREHILGLQKLASGDNMQFSDSIFLAVQRKG